MQDINETQLYVVIENLANKIFSLEDIVYNGNISNNYVAGQGIKIEDNVVSVIDNIMDLIDKDNYFIVDEKKDDKGNIYYIDDYGQTYLPLSTDPKKIVIQQNTISSKVEIHSIVMERKSKDLYYPIFDENCKDLFKDNTTLNTFTVKKGMTTNNIKNISHMFSGCTNLDHNKFNLTNFNLDKAVNMNGVFAGCTSLTDLDLSNWKINGVLDANSMFSGCTNLKNIKFSDTFTTATKCDLRNMFSNCAYLNDLDLSVWNTSNVIDMSYMFSGCSILTMLLLGQNFNTSNVTNMNSMFSGCKQFNNANDILSKFVTSSVTDMQNMFSGCINLDIRSFPTNFDITNVGSMQNMFSGCTSLTELLLNNNFVNNSTVNMQNMFSGCISLKSVAFPDNFNNGSIENIFSGCKSLLNVIINTEYEKLFTELLKLGTWFYNKKGNIYKYIKTTNAIKLYKKYGSDGAFSHYSDNDATEGNGLIYKPTENNISILEIQDNNTATNVNIYPIGYLTDNNGNIATQFTIKFKDDCVSMFNGSVIDTFRIMIEETGDSEDDVVSIDASNITNCEKMFWAARNLNSIINYKYFNTVNVRNMTFMFNQCDAITVDIFNAMIFDLSSVEDISYMFGNSDFQPDPKDGSVNKSVDIIMNVSKISDSTSMNLLSMFDGCKTLTSITFSKQFKPLGILSTKLMFNKCEKLHTITFNNSFNISTAGDVSSNYATDVTDMFKGCELLSRVNIPTENWTLQTALANQIAGSSWEYSNSDGIAAYKRK